MVDVPRGRVALLGATAALAGVADAAVLVLVVRIAVAVVGGDRSSTALGPLDLDRSTPALFGLAAGLAVARLLLSAASAWLMADLAATALGRMRKRTFACFVEASWSTQAAERDGHLQDLMTTHTTRVALSLVSLAAGLVALLNLVALLLTAFVVDPVASLVAMAGTALLFVALRPLVLAAKAQSAAANAANLDYVEAVAESVAMAEETHAFAAGPALRRRVDGLVDAVVARVLRTQALGRLLPSLNQSLAVGLVLAGLLAVHLAGGAEAASLGAVVLLLVRTLTYSQGLQSAYQQVLEVVPFAERLGDEQARYRLAAVPRRGAPLGPVRSVALDHVSFRYRPGPPVLDDVSFTVAAGETVGIVGPSGAGKSTLVQLLVRLRPASEGAVLVNGADAWSFSPDDWCRRVAYLPQAPRLFGGTVADNIRFFRDGVGDAEVEAAARLAHVHDEIVAWPDGYRTPAGPRGGELSGGQRQRICLARALLLRPDVLVLDEPTSALDPHSEALVRDTLLALQGTMTVFVVAHRLTALTNCDRIMVLGDGRVQAFDRAADVAASNRWYRDAVRLSEA